MTTKKTLLIGSGIVIAVCLFAFGYLAYNRTVPVQLPVDQQKEMLLPLIVLFYGEADTPENRDKYRSMTNEEMENILNSAVEANQAADSTQ